MNSCCAIFLLIGFSQPSDQAPIEFELKIFTSIFAVLVAEAEVPNMVGVIRR